MPRVQRCLLVLLITLLMPSLLWAAAAEMITISSTAIGPTAGLCQVGSPTLPQEQGLFVQILDQPVYYTIHGSTIVPSAVLGGVAPANTILLVDRASDFRAIRVTSDARAYLVCVPR